MKFTLSNQDFDSVLPLHERAKRLLRRLKNGRLLTQEEVATMLGVHKRSHGLRCANGDLRKYSLNVRTRSNRVTVWGNEKTIAALKKRQDAEQQ